MAKASTQPRLVQEHLHEFLIDRDLGSQKLDHSQLAKSGRSESHG
jgi:hypothetical protein